MKKGYGDYLITEPVTFKDILNTLSYGSKALILFMIEKMREVVFKDDLINIGFDIHNDDKDIYKHIKHRCKSYRSEAVFCTFHEVEGDTAPDQKELLRILRYNIWDAACCYHYVPEVKKRLEDLYNILRDAKELLPPEVYEVEDEEGDPLLYDTLETATEKVLKRTSYGMRQEEACKDGYILTWSNAGAMWIVNSRLVIQGEVIDLDANEVLVVGDKEHAENLAKKLPELPLYKYSLEGRLRGGQGSGSGKSA